MLPAGLLKSYLDHLIHLARRPWQRPEPSAFRPRLEVLETRAAPGGLGLAETPPPAPEPAVALVRVTESLVIDREPRRLPVLAARSFSDRLYGEDTADDVRGGKDLDVLFAGSPVFPPAHGLDVAVEWCSGKDDTALIFARQTEDALAADALFIGTEFAA